MLTRSPMITSSSTSCDLIAVTARRNKSVAYVRSWPGNCVSRVPKWMSARMANRAVGMPKGLEQLVEDLVDRHLHAREDRRVALRVLAALSLAQLHHQVEKVLRLVRLERDDEVLVQA